MKHLTRSEKQTHALGKKIATRLPRQTVVELVGDVGAGKTTLVKGLAQGLGVKDILQSPSYTIFARYETNERSLHHYDFYRLEEPGLMSYDVAESITEPNAVTVVEWAESVADILPTERIIIRLTPLGVDEREIEIKGLKL